MEVMLCKYDNIIKDQREKGIIKGVDRKSREGERKQYIPHHAVFTPAKDTTKVRICVWCFHKNEENKLKHE